MKLVDSVFKCITIDIVTYKLSVSDNIIEVRLLRILGCTVFVVVYKA